MTGSSALEDGPAPAAGAATSPRRSLFEQPFFVVVLGLFIGFASCWSTAQAVWRTNRFFDTDDAMRLVEVRDWLGGQAWFDMIERRLDPPLGTLMHWTRVVDVPLALLIRLFQSFTNVDAAERLTRLVYPALLQVCLFSAIYWIARKFAGARGAAFAVILAAFSVSVLTQFAPGRITHHNAQIVLLALMIGWTIDALDPMRARRGALAATAAALSLAISLEDLPFIATMVAVFGAAWVVRGESFARALAWFGGGLCLCAALAFVAVVPPWRYDVVVCDSYSPAHFVPACLGGAAFLVMAAASARLPKLLWRAIACAAAGGLVLFVEAACFRVCLGNPYVAVDPLARSIWLAHVTEAAPLGTMFAKEFWKALPIAAPIFLGLALAVVSALREQGAARSRWLALTAFLLMGACGAFWEVIVATYVAAFAPLGAARSFERLVERTKTTSWMRLIAPGALCVALAPLAWAAPNIVLQRAKEPDAANLCLASEAFTALRALPPGLVLGPIDAGPYVLAFTTDTALDGPYHRDNRGNRLALETFLGDAGAARASAREAGARYVIICPKAKEMALYARLAPNGLAARLLKGDAPSWLRAVPVRGTPFKVYEVQK